MIKLEAHQEVAIVSVGWYSFVHTGPKSGSLTLGLDKEIGKRINLTWQFEENLDLWFNKA